ncbi:MAG TPA: hypothetical protein PLZ43_03880, partial [bacterium]|nr:hypothetical protein [bacterium]
GNTGTVATVEEIQNGDYADKTYVDLEDVFVLSPARKHSDNTFSFYVASNAGDKKGILVYKMVDGSSFPYAEGDWLDIKGAVGVYHKTTDTYTSYQMQKAANGTGTNVVTKLSTAAATVPAAVAVSAADLMDISKLYAYVGVYVKVSDVKIKTIPNQYDLTLENDLVVDNMLVPADTFSTYTVGKEFTTISGIFDVDYDAPTIHPKTAGDLVAK